MHPSTSELVRRLKAKDPTIWGPTGTPELADRLGWIDLPKTMIPRLPEIGAAAAAALADRTDRVVLLGMGGSSLAPEVFAAVLGVAPGHPALTVLDSTHPHQVGGVADSIDPRRTLFIVSSKSGGTLETVSAFRYFWQLTGADGSRFLAITDPGSSLETMGRERGFRAVVTAPSDVGGRFSALTHFGLLPAALIGADPQVLLAAAGEVSWTESVEMGRQWAEAALAGRDKLTLVTSPGLAAFPAWMEQLVAESLGKDGKGIVPVAGEPVLEGYGNDRLFVSYRLAGQARADSPPGHEAIDRVVPDRYHLATEMLAAEIATAVAGAILGVHPFNQPDVELAKQNARRALEGTTPRVETIDCFSPVLADRLEALRASMRPGEYLGIHAYLPVEPSTDAVLAELRRRLGDPSGNATTTGYGPRFLHSTGQLHKGGPDNGLFLQLIDTPADDLPIPETDTTFGRVIASQAVGDFLALRERGRRVLRVDLGADRARGLATVLAALG
ncbi:MAG TPA: glucose-6-phosphate isomerase [Acidimicrobiia bacterium]|nr:glucose-6-phosphate isomerase [Acidimicrobiia bacterium]